MELLKHVVKYHFKETDLNFQEEEVNTEEKYDEKDKPFVFSESMLD